ncbi:oligosaccharide flippase family protein [uncultured Vagococcus sp.]|uniref:oligosaccharide flippase family protein n=1 Tax=uncultured Vagococcus sp. TaxID=189676 RepID=UPI0028D4F857|nr:oligosaccharide flippase family protein [uncultured Vagococcus sp.]
MDKIKVQLDKLKGKGFFYVFFGNFLVKFLVFSSSVFIVRLLGKTDFAKLAYVDNVLSFFLIMNGFGVSTSILRYTSMDSSAGEKKAYIFWGLKVGIGFNCLLMAIFLVIIKASHFPFSGVRQLLLLLILSPTCTFLFEYGTMILRGRLAYCDYALITIVYSLLMLLSMGVLAYLYGLKGVVISRYLSVIFSSLILLQMLKRYRTSKSRFALKKSNRKEFVSYSFYSMLANGLSLILPINEGFIVNNVIARPLISTQYKTAMQIPMGVQFIATAIIIFIFPYFSKNSENQRWVLEKSKNIQMVFFGVFSLVAIVAILLTPGIVQLLYGKSYLEIVPLMRVYWVVFSVNAGFRMLPGNILSAIGRAKFNMLNALMTMLLHLFFCLLMLSRYGIMGIPYALLASYLISGIISWLYLLNISGKNN